MTSADLDATEWDHSDDVSSPALAPPGAGERKMSREQLEAALEAQLNGKVRVVHLGRSTCHATSGRGH